MTIGERCQRRHRPESRRQRSLYPSPKHIRRVLTECIRGSRDDPQFTTKMTAAFESNSVLPPAARGGGRGGGDAEELRRFLSLFT